MPTHKAVRIASVGAALELVDVDTAPPTHDEVRIAVSACGVCGTDRAFVNGGFANTPWPLTPGHEIAGRVVELGEGVDDFEIGDRVAVARLVRRVLQPVRPLPQRRLYPLREHEGARLAVPRWLREIGDGARQRAGGSSSHVLGRCHHI